MNNIKCAVCKNEFCGHLNKIYCSRDCELKARRIRRRKRNQKSIEERQKIANKKSYLKNKYVKTKKY